MVNSRTRYALDIQASAKDEIEKQMMLLRRENSEWEFGLSAAPTTVSAMAILFRAASHSKTAQGLVHMKADYQVVTGEQGKVIGHLPYEVFTFHSL